MVAERIHSEVERFIMQHNEHPDKLTLSEGLLFDLLNNDIKHIITANDSPPTKYMGMDIEISSGEDVIYVSHRNVRDYRSHKLGCMYNTLRFNPTHQTT